MNGGVGRRPAASRGPARHAPRQRGSLSTAPTAPALPAAPTRLAGPARRLPTTAPQTPVAATPSRPPRGLLRWRRANRRVTVESRSAAVWIVERLAALARRLLVVGKILAALVVLVAALAAGRLGVKHVVESPRFSLREFRIGPTSHVSREDVITRSGVAPGSQLLALDTDRIAARLARHPWIAAARVRRELPATLVIDVVERRAAAVAVIGGLYLIDEQGRPFKPATLEETDGLVVITGISRGEYRGLPRASEGAFREALGLLAAYQDRAEDRAQERNRAAVPRPRLSEIHIDPRTGFSLVLYDGGGEIRLGRGAVPDKLGRLDQILAELGPAGPSVLRVVHLDGKAADRVPIRLAPLAAADPVAVSLPAAGPPPAPRASRPGR